MAAPLRRPGPFASRRARDAARAPARGPPRRARSAGASDPRARRAARGVPPARLRPWSARPSFERHRFDCTAGAPASLRHPRRKRSSGSAFEAFFRPGALHDLLPLAEADAGADRAVLVPERVELLVERLDLLHQFGVTAIRKPMPELCPALADLVDLFMDAREMFILCPTTDGTATFPSVGATQQKRNYHERARREGDPEDDVQRPRHS